MKCAILLLGIMVASCGKTTSLTAPAIGTGKKDKSGKIDAPGLTSSNAKAQASIKVEELTEDLYQICLTNTADSACKVKLQLEKPMHALLNEKLAMYTLLENEKLAIPAGEKEAMLFGVDLDAEKLTNEQDDGIVYDYIRDFVGTLDAATPGPAYSHVTYWGSAPASIVVDVGINDDAKEFSIERRNKYLRTAISVVIKAMAAFEGKSRPLDDKVTCPLVSGIVDCPEPLESPKPSPSYSSYCEDPQAFE